jgi:opacity protein-like surface antigen
MKMFFFLLLGIAVTGSAFAQRIKPGVGVNFTDFSQDPATGEVKGKAGFQIGGSVEFGKKLLFEPGIFYVGKTSEYTTGTGSTASNITAGLQGIRVPVALGLEVLGKSSSTFGVRLFGGPSAFFVTKISDDLDQAQRDNISKTNFGLFAGAGLDLSLFYVDASYEWSMTNIQKEIQNIDLGKTRSFFLTAGLRF